MLPRARIWARGHRDIPVHAPDDPTRRPSTSPATRALIDDLMALVFHLSVELEDRRIATQQREVGVRTFRARSRMGRDEGIA